MSEEPVTADASADLATPLSNRRAAAELFLISVLILFLELACIRWFPAHVLFLTFFTNVVLVACFLGMSLGCLAAGHRRNYLNSTASLLAIAMMVAGGVEAWRKPLGTILDVGHQASPQLVFFGTEYRFNDAAQFAIPIEWLEGFFFVLIALVLIGPGQELGRALKRLPNRVRAYTQNIAGSIVGIALFFFCSWLQMGPGWWFLWIALALCHFLFRNTFGVRRLAQVALLAAMVFLANTPMLLWHNRPNEEIWSPYYRVNYFPIDQSIVTNLIGHQTMVSCWEPYCAYALPYLLSRDAAARSFQDVLIIGAGSGNDVSRALQWGAGHIDAVEIDPVIWRIGKTFHPDQPYDDASHVTVRLTDGRNFLRWADKKYDLIIYALVDSLVLHSSYSNIRLESYLFTREAFADVKRRLKPDGLFVMYNYYRQGWIVARLAKTLREVFETEPLVLTMPYQAVVEPDDRSQGFTFLVAGTDAALEPLRKAFHWPTQSTDKDGAKYWVESREISDPQMPNGFRQTPSPADLPNWQAFAPAHVVEPANLTVATDDWPFLYLREPMIPNLSLRGAAVMAVLAMALLSWFVPPRLGVERPTWMQEVRSVIRFWANRQWFQAGARLFDGRMFFLGAGFMLIETKAVVHLALLFGSTWVVNSVVFSAVLVMILLANLFVLAIRPAKIWPFYVGLFITLILNAIIPVASLLGLQPWLQVTGSCLLVFAPILFAAVIFAVSFGRTAEADRAFGFNIAGAVLGGLAEYSSMLLGFRYLMLVAIGFYAMSAIFLNGACTNPSQESPQSSG